MAATVDYLPETSRLQVACPPARLRLRRHVLHGLRGSLSISKEPWNLTNGDKLVVAVVDDDER